MRIQHGVAAVAAALTLTACNQGANGPVRLDTDNQKASYGVGLNVGRSLRGAEDSLDMKAFSKGVEDAMNKRDPAVPQEEIQAALKKFGDAVMANQQAKQAAAAKKNEEEGQAYLKENGAKQGVTTTASGLQYEVLKQGDGPMPTDSDKVRVNYKGTLIDGTEFDSSYKRGTPATFPVKGVIPGWTEALQKMKVGSTWELFIPPKLAYGERGAGHVIGPDSTLIFEVELLSIKK